jgi:histidinol-phosphate aminotransferase
MTAPLPRPGILDIQAYQAGESKIPGKSKIIKLASNESPLGASPQVAAAITAGFDSLHLYPDPMATELREALAAANDVPAAQILCTNGSEQVLHLLARTFAGPGDEVIYSQYGFIAYPIAIKAAGAAPVVAAEENYTTVVDNILKAVSPRTKLIFLANPNNPTGTYLPDSEIRRLHAALPENVLLVLDEAYAEYVTAEDYQSGFHLLREGAQNVVVSRTFSKIYGLAATRVGWTVCPPGILDPLNRVRETFNVTALSQRAARAALTDAAHMQKARAHNTQWLPWLSRQLTDMGLYVSPSQGNFVLAHFKDADTARAANSHLRQEHGIIVRPVAGYGLPAALRITVGTEEENHALVEGFRRFLER